MRAINIGGQSFEDIRKSGVFYVDKTAFIKEWWENEDSVTLITRPRRFGKTLNMQMLECFFSSRYAGRGEELFGGLDIWKGEKYRKLQGTYPVIYLSFADVKETTFENARLSIIGVLQALFDTYKYEWADDTEGVKLNYEFLNIDPYTPDPVLTRLLQRMSFYLYQRYGKKVLIFLDEYDTPLQEAYVNGYWKEMSDFIRSLFNSTFKTNPSLERAVMTGITRVSKESIFSDLNNPEIITATSTKYETAFGFTEREVDDALSEYGLSDQKANVKKWYDGFTFGNRTDIYNPWSITNFLDKRKFAAYWANTSSNRLISDLVAGNTEVQCAMETLLTGGTIDTTMSDEDVVYSDLDGSTDAIWSLMVSSGYLRIDNVKPVTNCESLDIDIYSLSLTNGETRLMFARMIDRWFEGARTSTNAFINAMLSGNIKEMNTYMNRIAETSFSYFDVGDRPSESVPPERFYHGFVLGLLVNEYERYSVKSNRESGMGRYDICMYPKKSSLPGIIMEFKVIDESDGEKDLADTADAALAQIKARDYASDLHEVGVTDIMEYGFAFQGKKVLIKKA